MSDPAAVRDYRGYKALEEEVKGAKEEYRNALLRSIHSKFINEWLPRSSRSAEQTIFAHNNSRQRAWVFSPSK